MVCDKLRNGNFSKSQVFSEICKNQIRVNQRIGEDWVHQRCILSICFFVNSKSSLQLTIKVKSNSVVFDKKMNRGQEGVLNWQSSNKMKTLIWKELFLWYIFFLSQIFEESLG